MINPSLYEIRVQADGSIQYYYHDGYPLFAVKKDNPPRYNENIKCPPMVQGMMRLKDSGNDYYGTVRTRMAHGPVDWTPYIQKLNGSKWKDAVGPHLAMYNQSIPDGEEWSWPEYDKQESLCFGLGTIVRAEPGPVKPDIWAHIILDDFEAGPPPGMPTWWEDPVHSTRFTLICRSGEVLLRPPDFFYPMTASEPVYMKWEMLEPLSPDTVNKIITRPVYLTDFLEASL